MAREGGREEGGILAREGEGRESGKGIEGNKVAEKVKKDRVIMRNDR